MPKASIRIHFLFSPKTVAKQAAQQLIDIYGENELDEADLVVAIGGDDTTLKALHNVLGLPEKPAFAMQLSDA